MKQVKFKEIKHQFPKTAGCIGAMKNTAVNLMKTG
jgi:hypothetical protein